LFPRSDENTRFRYQTTYIFPGQTEYEFNVTPELIGNDFDDIPKIADLALIGIIEGDSLKIKRYRDNTFSDQITLDLSGEESSSEYFYVNTYDHRSSFWQKITLSRDLSPAWWKLILAIALGIASYVCSISVSYNSDRSQKIAVIILCVIISLIIIYGIMWEILSSY
jgi:lipopolysaccharide export LptBFGC system permease protein LptF